MNGNTLSIVHQLHGRIVKMALLLLCCTVVSGLLFAQKASVTLERDQILLGDQISVTLKAENIHSQSLELEKWFSFSNAPHIEVIRRGKVDTVNDGENISYVQKVIVTSFDSGKWNLPVVPPVLKDRQTGRSTVLSVDSVSLTVLPVDVKDLKDYHDIKEVEQVKYFDTSKIFLIAGIVIGVVLLFLLIRWIVRRVKRKKNLAGEIPENMDPLTWTLNQLGALQKEDLPVKSYFTKMDDISRKYLDARLKIRSRQKTSDEIRTAVKEFLQDSSDFSTFSQIMRLSDAVKFAKYIPENTVKEETVTALRTILEHLDKEAASRLSKNA